MPVKNILIMGASGDYNLGDELIVESEIAYFQRRFPTANISVCVYDAESQVSRPPHIRTMHYFPYQIRRRPFANIAYFFQNILALVRADILVVGGGGIFFDNESGTSFRRTLWQWYLRIALARLFGARIVFFGISLEIEKKENLKYLTKLFHTDDIVLSRDTRSTERLSSIGIEAHTISDVAFLSGTPQHPKSIESIKRVGVSLRGGFTRDDTMISSILTFLHTRGYEVVFLSHSLHPRLSHNDAELVKHLEHCLRCEVTRTLDETLAAYQSLDAVIGMRFHSLVLSALHAIPTLPISYGSKTEMLAEQLELDALSLRSRDWDIRDFAKKWQYLETHYESLSRHISTRASDIQKKLLQQLESPAILDL